MVIYYSVIGITRTTHAEHDTFVDLQAGPSGTHHTPDPDVSLAAKRSTPVKSRSEVEILVSHPSSHKLSAMSQAVLVSSQLTVVEHMPSRSQSRNRTIEEAHSPLLEKAIANAEPTIAHRSGLANAILQNLSPARAMRPISPDIRADAGQVKHNKRRRQVVAVQNPTRYPHTRSRSRSVDPQAASQTTERMSANVWKGKTRMVVVPESEDEGDIEIPHESPVPGNHEHWRADNEEDIVPTPEINQDEEDVENLLGLDGPVNSAGDSSGTRRSRPDLEEDSGHDSEAGLSSDDQRVSWSLLARQGQTSLSGVLLDDDEAFAAGLNMSLVSTNARTDALPNQFSITVAANDPSTPFTPRTARKQLSEASSTSSSGMVPIPGTRASEEKRRRNIIAKHSPYVPPPGSRAATLQSNLERKVGADRHS